MEKPSESERIERLEKIAVQICDNLLTSDYSWQEWARPLREFVNEIYTETHGHGPYAKMEREFIKGELEKWRMYGGK